MLVAACSKKYGGSDERPITTEPTVSKAEVSKDTIDGKKLDKKGVGMSGFTPEALDALRHHLWPGNVRELDHVIERAVLMSPGNIVTAFDLALEATPDARMSARLEEMSLEDAERLLIKKALARFEGNANRAAEALGLSRSALYRRLQKYGLGS